MPFATLFPLLFSACNSIVSFIYEQFEPLSPLCLGNRCKCFLCFLLQQCLLMAAQRVITFLISEICLMCFDILAKKKQS